MPGGFWRVGGGGGDRTVAGEGGFVVEVVPEDGCGAVQQDGDLLLAAALVDDLGEQIGVVPPAGLDEALLLGGALHSQVSIVAPNEARRLPPGSGRGALSDGARLGRGQLTSDSSPAMTRSALSCVNGVSMGHVGRGWSLGVHAGAGWAIFGAGPSFGRRGAAGGGGWLWGGSSDAGSGSGDSPGAGGPWRAGARWVPAGIVCFDWR